MTTQNAKPLDVLTPYFVDKCHPLMEAKTIQIILMREVLDYTVLRTEESRELNTVVTPLSVKHARDERRVAFLAGKQKAAESRELERMLRTAVKAAKVPELQKECYLKDDLCMECPRCALHGGTITRTGAKRIGNIKHRVEYGTAFSLRSFKEIGDAITFNAINDVTIQTGQALGTRYVVNPASLFPSIVTLRSVTKREFILTVKVLLATKSYGAESRIGGDVRNTIYGVVAGWEEIITPLELTIELYDQQEKLSGETVKEIVEKYKPLAGNHDQVQVLSPTVVDAIVKAASETKLDKGFLKAVYQDVVDYRKVQAERSKRK